VRYNLPESFGISVISSEVEDGPMNLSNPENIKLFCRKIAFPTPLSQAEQIHKNIIAPAKPGATAKGADGLFAFDITPLSIRSADCAPIFLTDPGTGFLCGIHCGRKSLLRGIISKSFKTLLNDNSIRPENIRVFIGPHIRVNNYSLYGKDIKPIMVSHFVKYVKDYAGNKCFNLTGALCGELEKIGIRENNIVDCKINTFTDKRFFSYRRGDSKAPEVFITICRKNVN